MIDPRTPGLAEVNAVLRQALAPFGVDERAIEIIGVVILREARPPILAEALADTADELADDFPEIGRLLDQASNDIREAVAR